MDNTTKRELQDNLIKHDRVKKFASEYMGGNLEEMEKFRPGEVNMHVR